MSNSPDMSDAVDVPAFVGAGRRSEPSAAPLSPLRGAWCEVKDEELVMIAVQGNTTAFDELVRRHERAAFNVAYRMLGSYDEASDLVQDAFLRAYRALATFRQDAAFSTWLHRILVNLCINRRKRWKVWRRKQTVSLDEPLGDEDGPTVGDMLSGDVPSPHDTVVSEQQARRIQHAIAELAPDHRAIVILRDIEGRAYDEIAAILEISEGTVKSRLNRARARLRKSLETLL
ncbi:MAG: sigma-70 family RNA polymerase sigma factor [Candidatus Schekmanbacteria bacterium]|nr:sigma-70 family RNA polymerase sigma factor [Candidatus Schekmanbacteria bacterium]